jgi:uncharacterized BrkB/YihY/UPF0761 family membrane protein
MLFWNALEGMIENRDLSNMLFERTDSLFPILIILISLFGLFLSYIHQIVSMNRKDNWVYCPTLNKTLDERDKEEKKRSEDLSR